MAEPKIPTSAGMTQQLNGSAKTVLVVEDNDLNMKLFHDLLEAHGYNILQTKDGMEALRLAREHRPDLILMDIQLPEVSGLEVTKWLKEDESLKTIPVIAVTAFAMKGDEEKIREGGCEAYIAKPISVTNFLQTVEPVGLEDNDLNMKLFHDLLEAHGYNILQTKDGMEALRFAANLAPSSRNAMVALILEERVWLNRRSQRLRE